MLTHEELVARMLADPAVREECAAQAEEFALLDERLRARRLAGLTQGEVAERMGAKAPAVARLEARDQPSPSLATLRKYAEAVGCRLEIRLRPCETSSSDAGLRGASTMTRNPILEERYAIREQLLVDAGGDLQTYLAGVRDREAASGLVRVQREELALAADSGLTHRCGERSIDTELGR